MPAGPVAAVRRLTTPAAGIGWRHAHEAALLQQRPALGFIEVHAENYFADGGAALATLAAARAHYPVSLHGVGLGLGSAAGLDPWHLDRLARLVARTEPRHVSEHAAFARAPLRPGGAPVHAADLLPPAFTDASLALMVRQVQQVQDRLKRPLLIENLAAYLHWDDSTWAEVDFFNGLVQRSGCRLLLDLNNLVVNALNRGHADPLPAVQGFVDALSPGAVAEIHLAGHHRPPGGNGLVIDDHGSAVPPVVWQAYALALARLGPCDTLVEWDTRLPALPVLVAEADRADQALQAAAASASRGASGSAGGSASCSAATVPFTDTPKTHPLPVHPLQAGALAAEATRQQGLVAALFTPWPGAATSARAAGLADRPGSGESRPGAEAASLELSGVGAALAAQPQGLATYRAHARVVAPRALGARYPTVAALVGSESWSGLARRHWLAAPPQRGDLADWGDSLPDALAQDPQLAEWPYLSGVARLDAAVQACANAADVPAAPQGLALLADVLPEALVLLCPPGTSLLTSPWPLASLWVAHQPDAPPAAWGAARRGVQAALQAATQAAGHGPVPSDTTTITAGHAPQALQVSRAPQAAPVQGTLVWRPIGQWRVRVRAAGAGESALLAAVLGGASLGQSIDAALAAQADWSFEAWLIQALRDGLLAEVQPWAAPVPC